TSPSGCGSVASASGTAFSPAGFNIVFTSACALTVATWLDNFVLVDSVGACVLEQATKANARAEAPSRRFTADVARGPCERGLGECSPGEPWRAWFMGTTLAPLS